VRGDGKLRFSDTPFGRISGVICFDADPFCLLLPAEVCKNQHSPMLFGREIKKMVFGGRMFRKPLFWIVFAAASLGSIYFAARYFSGAFPIVTLDLQMNRDQALTSSAALASKFQLSPAGYRQVASFSGDEEVQTFVELEAGGTAAFQAMMAAGFYHPYQWTVRHFKPGETRETALRFTPRGDPYGFSVKLPEKEAGAALEPERAREIAEQAATRDWSIHLGEYRLVEQSKEVRPGGRVDHTFVYERPDVQVGEGRYRLRLVVGGDRLTGLTHLVKVPEAFTRRYEQMRSANNAVGVAGSIALLVLYVIGGCAIGLFFLLRQRWILWRKPLLWGAFIAFLQLLAGINQWPLVWMSYDTAVSSQGFVLQQILLLLLSFLGYAVLFTVSFMAAESLTRRAFPHQIQHWKLWSSDVAASKAVLGRTVSGYLLVGILFGYEVLLYFVASRWLGWWTPSDALVQPDVLANYFPWLTSIAVSAQAGFWEETLFRAVPIAGAALLGTRFGRRGWWIAGAMVVQALVFGSGHAGYATQPYFARLVELIIPSFMFGGLYIVFGLLPAIVLHFTFDVVWFALPLFVSTAPGIWMNRIFVVALVFTPLWVVLVARWRVKAWKEVPEAVLNRSWQPAEASKPAVAEESQVPRALSSAMVRYLPIAGALGLVLWIFAAVFKTNGPPLNVSREQAKAIAAQAMEQRGVRLPGPWTALTAIVGQPDQQDRFIWQTAGRETYGRLMNEYLSPPHWTVRFVQFEGDVAARAEEYQVLIAGNGRVHRVKHTLPEAAAGKSIAEGEARILAREAMIKEFQIEPSTLKEVSAVPSKLKARTDWMFTFSAEGDTKLPQGERRIAVQISGDQVADVYRFVHVPEEWKRQERDRDTLPMIVNIGSSVVLVGIVVTGIIAAIVSWSRKRFVVSSFLLISALLLLLSLAGFVNSIPSLTAQFSTAQPYKIQMFVLVGLGLLGLVLVSVSMGLVAGLGHYWCLNEEPLSHSAAWLVGLSLGSIAAGILALGSLLGPSLTPKWAAYGLLNGYVPQLGSVTGPVSGYFMQTIIMVFIFAALNRFTRNWSGRKIPFGMLLFLLGFVVAGTAAETMQAWLMQGAITGCLLLATYLLVLRFSVKSCIIAVGAIQIFDTLKQGISAAYPMALPLSLLAAVLVGLATWFWHRRIEKGDDHGIQQQ